MTRKQRRGVIIIVGLALLGIATVLVGWKLRSTITYFKTPSEVAGMPIGVRFRLGGLVVKGSFQKDDTITVHFIVTDGASSIPVVYNKSLPDLFREGQGVVAEGALTPEHVFAADTVLAKHDEKYTPPEITDALKKSGYWQKTSGKLEKK